MYKPGQKVICIKTYGKSRAPFLSLFKIYEIAYVKDDGSEFFEISIKHDDSFPFHKSVDNCWWFHKEKFKKLFRVIDEDEI